MCDHPYLLHRVGHDRDLVQLLPDAASVTRLLGGSFGDLSRLLDRPEARACLRELALAGRGRLTIDPALRRTGGPHPALQGRARIHGRGLRIARSTRVEIELRSWPPSSVELRLRPTERDPFRWGRRRHRRYFELAHLAADRLHAVLCSLSSADPVPTGIHPCGPRSVAA